MSAGIRMIRADLLKLRRRRALMAWSGLLFVGAQLLFYGYGAVRHASDAAHFGPAGGTHGLANAIMLVSYLGGVAAVMIGTAAGGGDAAAGVLRDLVSLGRSRLALFAVRLPAALLVVLAFIIPALAVATAPRRPRTESGGGQEAAGPPARSPARRTTSAAVLRAGAPPRPCSRPPLPRSRPQARTRAPATLGVPRHESKSLAAPAPPP